MNKKGQALIEFVLIMPVMVYLILVLVDFSLIMSTKNKLDNDVSNLVMEYKKTGLCPDGAVCKSTDKYEKITIKEKYVPKTPGLSLILKDPYYITSERVVLKDE